MCVCYEGHTDVLPLKGTSEMALDEGGLASGTISNKENLELRNNAGSSGGSLYGYISI